MEAPILALSLRRRFSDSLAVSPPVVVMLKHSEGRERAAESLVARQEVGQDRITAFIEVGWFGMWLGTIRSMLLEMFLAHIVTLRSPSWPYR